MRFVFEKDRQFFGACRTGVRMVLSHYLETSADKIEFRYCEKGKPRVAVETDLRFNVSHSGGLAIVALTRGCEVGADVELVRPVPEIDAIARRFFCAEECSELLELAVSERPAAFFRCWTRKEAYIKATGDGLSAPLDQFRVTLGADNEVRFVHINNRPQEAARWTLQNLSLSTVYAGALAYQAPAKQIRYFNLSGSDALRS